MLRSVPSMAYFGASGRFHPSSCSPDTDSPRLVWGRGGEMDDEVRGDLADVVTGRGMSSMPLLHTVSPLYGSDDY